jgi:hypothetical protein
VLDGDYSEAFSEPDGGARFGPADAGALSDPDQWQRASSGRLGLVSDDGKDGHRFNLQMLGY